MSEISLTRDDVLGLYERVKNWGRWGPEDELGTLNLITPEARLRGVASVRDGVSISCANPLDVVASEENTLPVTHAMLRAGDIPGTTSTADYFAIATHGMAHTHLDALCHFFVEGHMYNDYPLASVSSEGALKNAITAGANGIVSRGVLLDLPLALGRDYLEPAEAMHPADLEAAEERAGVRVQAGDIVLLRTGRWLRRRKVGAWNGRDALAGLYADCLPWLHQKAIAVLVCDGVSDVMPSRVEGIRQPIHGAIAIMGLHLLDNANLEEVARAAAERNRYEFLFTIAPLRLEGGTGCPVNPIALF
jgi:kynurenine formamidase